MFSIAALYKDEEHTIPQGNKDSLDRGFIEDMNRQNIRQPVIRGSDDYVKQLLYANTKHHYNLPFANNSCIISFSSLQWPQDPASHGPHLFVNSLNSLLFSQVGLHDWDMVRTMIRINTSHIIDVNCRKLSHRVYFHEQFQTNQGKPSYMHAAARAIRSH
jgi:hypothetical protein